jgi:hypothetical protein
MSFLQPETLLGAHYLEVMQTRQEMDKMRNSRDVVGKWQGVRLSKLKKNLGKDRAVEEFAMVNRFERALGREWFYPNFEVCSVVEK